MCRLDARGTIKLAKEIKNRNNEKQIGHVVGTVVSINPLKVSVLGGQAFFSGNLLIVGNKLLEYTETVNITIDGVTKQATIEHDGLQLNDSVLCQFTQDNQKLIVLDKV